MLIMAGDFNTELGPGSNQNTRDLKSAGKSTEDVHVLSDMVAEFGFFG